MAVSDDDGTAERLAQVRAQRRHLGRLRTAERPAVEQLPGVGSLPSAETRTLLIAEEAALELDRAALAAEREAGIDVDMDI
jgi:hypothetical protein